MGKRRSRGQEAPAIASKRQKIVHEAPSSEEIHTGRQLQQLLSFDQDLHKARHGLQSFKVFLDELSANEGDKSSQLALLRDYLEAAKPRVAHDGDDDETLYLADIMETWSFAAQVNNDNILSAVPVALALLLRLVSQVLDFAPYGARICRTLLQKRQQELLARNLSAEKGKEFIISPTLRLLREVVCFDGGVFAKTVFRARNYTLRLLSRNMSIKFLGEGIEDAKRPSARTNAVRFLLSCIKYLHTEARRELLSQKDVIAALSRSLKDDPPHLLHEMLDVMKSSVLMDSKLPRDAKARLFNSTTLSRLASLYTYSHDSETDAGVSVQDAVHSLLMVACTTPDIGVTHPQAGYYPKGIDEDAFSRVVRNAEGLTLDRIIWMNQFKGEVPVRNVVLSEFIQILRPWSNVKQIELLVAIFQSCPELVASYFLRKQSFTFEPKLSSTWLGYAAFLFQTIQLPIPEYFGQKKDYAVLPPPTSVVIDNILPLPLNQKILTRCLSLKSDLIPFFATRLLVTAIQKLEKAVLLYRGAAEAKGPIWEEGSRRLIDEFCARSPDMKEVINSYRSIPEANILHREATSRLLLLYYRAIPQAALTAKFDVTPFLVSAIKRLSTQELEAQDHVLILLELENLVAIAGYSPGMKWFTKGAGLSTSPFTALLRLSCEAPDGMTLENVRATLNFIATEQELVRSQGTQLGITTLIDAIRCVMSRGGGSMSVNTWGFIDNCSNRCANAPIKYIESMQELENPKSTPTQSSYGAISPILLTMVEQLPFVIKSADNDAISSLSSFLAVYISSARNANENENLLRLTFDRVLDIVPKKLGKSLKAIFKEMSSAPEADTRLKKATSTTSTASRDVVPGATEQGTASHEENLSNLFSAPLAMHLDNSSLVKWPSKTVDEIVEDGFAERLIRLLSSDHASIRKEALTNILKMAVKIRESTYDEKDQIWLLLSELAETVTGQVLLGPLPGPVVAFCCHALEVLKNPLHGVYAKVNMFLTRRPAWSLDKLPLVHEMLHEEPSADDQYWLGISWLLTYLLDSLRTPADMALFHKRRVFERLLSLSGNPYMRQGLRMNIMHLLYRATSIEGGSTTLVTRFGVLSWLETQRAAAGMETEARICRELLKRVWETCDQDRIASWSNDAVSDMVKAL